MTFRLLTTAALSAFALSLMAPAALACSILPPKMPPALTPMIGETEESFRQRQTLHLDGFQALQNQTSLNATRERQLALWTGAARVAVVELEKLETEVEIPNQPMGKGARATVRAVSWIKAPAAPGDASGKGKKKKKDKSAGKTFTLAHVSYTSCGPMPSWPVFYGQTGARYLVFFGEGEMAQDNVQGVVAVSDIVAGELVTALAARAR